jgi:hypothetical protein
MSRRIHGRLITAATLAAAAALASPAHAASPDWRGAPGWLLDAWHQLGTWLGTGESHGQAGTKAASSLLKTGAGVNPDGYPVTGTGTDASTTSTPDRGAGVDPDG